MNITGYPFGKIDGDITTAIFKGDRTSRLNSLERLPSASIANSMRKI